MKTYIYVYAEWYSSNGSMTSIRCNNITHEELIRRAVEMGYRAPKWYQLWIKPIMIFGTEKGEQHA